MTFFFFFFYPRFGKLAVSPARKLRAPLAHTNPIKMITAKLDKLDDVIDRVLRRGCHQSGVEAVFCHEKGKIVHGQHERGTRQIRIDEWWFIHGGYICMLHVLLENSFGMLPPEAEQTGARKRVLTKFALTTGSRDMSDRKLLSVECENACKNVDLPAFWSPTRRNVYT
jgi:hypothetical protein